jgi:hypothetical protein
MNVLDYKLISKNYTFSSDNKIDDYVNDNLNLFNLDFEKLIKNHLKNGYTPLGGISVTLDVREITLVQSLVLYED